MTTNQYNHFLTLLMGGCWHEKWDWRPNDFGNAPYVCLECNARAHEVPQRPDHLSNPLPVIRWMEREMPQELDDYLLGLAHSKWREDETGYPHIAVFKEQLDLRNLVQYLKEHTEAPFMWGFTPCPSFPSCMSGETDKCDFPDKGCEGDGKVRGHIHPALKYLRGVKGE